MIFLQILKIIGIILLILIGIILFLLFVILFYPLCYNIKGDFDSPNIDVKLKGHWLLHFISFKGYYNNNDYNFYYKLLFKKHFLFDEKANDDDEDAIYDDDNDNDDINDIIKEKEDTNNPASDNKSDGNSAYNNLDSDSKQDNIERDADFDDNKNQNKKFDNLKNKIVNLKQKYNKIKSLYNDNRNKQAFLHLKDEVIILLKHINPNKLKLDIIYSTGSPDTTAYILGILALFPISYKNKWNIVPDFETENWYIKGNCDIKGRIFLYKLLGIAIRIFFDKNCRRLYNKIRN